MKLAAARLANYYDQKGSWQQLVDDKRVWRQLASGIVEAPYGDYRRSPRPIDQRPLLREEISAPGGRANRKDRSLYSDSGMQPGLPPPVKNRVERQPIDMTLLDHQNNYISGYGRLVNNFSLIRMPIRSKSGIVGYLLARKQTRITEAIDQNFAESLNRSVLIVLGFSLAFTFVISTLLARNLSRPIKNLSKATHQLSQGNYGTRMATGRSDEMGQLAEDFNLLAKTLDTNRNSRQRWIADLSHELRTPLAVLKGELMAIKDGVRRLDHTSLTSLINETERFSRMVNDLYDLSRADAGDLDYRMEQIDLIGALKESIEHFKPRFTDKKLRLSMQSRVDEIIVEADFGRITQLFSNLLENSLRYTHSGGQAKITCSKQASSVVVVFEDTLPGAPESSLEKIFERLYRVETSRSRQHGGGGLGLALCKTIVEAHQGTISAQKSKLGGLKIEVAFPLLNTSVDG